MVEAQLVGGNVFSGTEEECHCTNENGHAHNNPWMHWMRLEEAGRRQNRCRLDVHNYSGTYAGAQSQALICQEPQRESRWGCICMTNWPREVDWRENNFRRQDDRGAVPVTSGWAWGPRNVSSIRWPLISLWPCVCVCGCVTYVHDTTKPRKTKVIFSFFLALVCCRSCCSFNPRVTIQTYIGPAAVVRLI